MQSKKKTIEREGMRVQELSEFLGVSYVTAYKLSHQPGFPVVTIGKRRIIPKTLLMKWLEEQAQRQEV